MANITNYVVSGTSVYGVPYAEEFQTYELAKRFAEGMNANFQAFNQDDKAFTNTFNAPGSVVLTGGSLCIHTYEVLKREVSYVGEERGLEDSDYT